MLPAWLSCPACGWATVDVDPEPDPEIALECTRCDYRQVVNPRQAYAPRA